jgi:hypothetical protein
MKARTGSIVKRQPRRKGARATWWARITYASCPRSHPLSEVGRVLGHTQTNTTYLYVNANVETAKRAAAALDAFNAEATEAAPTAELVH